MWQEHRIFDRPTGQTGTGASQNVSGLVDKYVQVHGTFTATVEIQGRFSTSTPWVTIASVSAAGLTSVPQPYLEMRLNVPAWTSGQPEAVLGGVASAD